MQPAKLIEIKETGPERITPARPRIRRFFACLGIVGIRSEEAFLGPPFESKVRPLNNLFQFSPVQPDASARGAIFDLNALAITHAEFTTVVGAIHRRTCPGVSRFNDAGLRRQRRRLPGILPYYIDERGRRDVFGALGFGSDGAWSLNRSRRVAQSEAATPPSNTVTTMPNKYQLNAGPSACFS